MPLKHADIWRAIDCLAEQNGLSASGLAKKSGLSPTVFNPSKRISKKRARWPSTESIAQILQATDTTLDNFVALATGGTAPQALPLLSIAQASAKGVFDEDGKPSGRGWEELKFPALADPHAFAFEISGKQAEPVYRDGDRIVLSPIEKPRRGDRVVVRTQKGDIIVGELNRESANKIEIVPFHAEAAAIGLAPRDIEWIYRVVWASQ